MRIECGSCGASLSLEPHLRTATCPYCASPSVVERASTAERPSPTFALGFSVGHEAARACVRDWQRTRGVFTDSGFKRAAVDSVKGVYVPAYLYSAVARSSYRAEIGENYETTETYTTTDDKGNTVTETRTVVHTEWRELVGPHAEYVTDVLVTASRGIGNGELEAIEPFDLKTLRRYAPALLSGWIAEEPTMSLAECAALARGEALAQVGRAIAGFMPGDSHRNVMHNTVLERETIDLVLVPVWVLSMRHRPDKPPIRLLVNGQTAKIWGKAPLSWTKILLTVAAALGALVAMVLAVALLLQR